MTEEERLDRITKFKKAFEGIVATTEDAFYRLDGKYKVKQSRFYSKDEIKSIVESGDPVERAALSEFFFQTNGIYQRIILHYATFLTYSWVLVPQLKKRTFNITDKRAADAYYAAADFCTAYQIERKCANFAKDILVKGAYYGLLRDEGNKVIIQDLPFEYCRSRFKNGQDVDLVEFNLEFFKKIRENDLREELLRTYPKFIQKAYKRYISSGDKSKKWIFLPAEMGIYFCFFEERPFFLHLIPLLDDLDDYREIDKARKLKALKRILVQQVGTDGLNLVFEPEEAAAMHDATLGMMSNNTDIDVLTTYNKVDLLDLSSSDDEKTEVAEFQNLIYEAAGTSKEFFYATTEAGLAYSTNNDIAMMMVLGLRFAHFFTSLLNYKFENQKVKFELIILPLSYYNSADYTSRAKELAAFGYSFLTPILSTGLNQTNLANLKILENELLNLDIILKPLQSAYTQSGKAQGEPVADATETTEKKTESETEKESDKKEEKGESKEGGGEDKI